jgi:hypothetical protein
MAPDQIIELNGKDNIITLKTSETYIDMDGSCEGESTTTIEFRLTPNDVSNLIKSLGRAKDRAVQKYNKPIIMRW